MLAGRFTQKLIGFVTDIIVGILGLRIILKLLGASTVAPFVTWVYETTKPLLTPFQGMFPSSDLAPRFTLEFSSLFALIAYSFIGYVLSSLVDTVDFKEGSKK